MAGKVAGFGNQSNIILPQTGHGHNPNNTGPQHLPQAPFPHLQLPVKLPWGTPSTGLSPR